MKKTVALVLLALAVGQSVAASSDAQRLYIKGYRIGESDIAPNDGRIVATNCSNTVSTSDISLQDNRLANKAFFNASVPAGLELSEWVVYNGDPTIAGRSPTKTNKYEVVEYVREYDSSDVSSKYIVVDYDYITYTLNYNAAGGSGDSMSPESRIYTNEFNLAANEFSRTGYTYDGWTNATGTAFVDEQTVSGADFGVTYTNLTATLYAKWNPHTYTVSFDDGTDDTVTGEMSPMTLTYDSPTNLTANAFVRSGYRFSGWATEKEGASAYDDGVEVVNLAADQDAKVCLYAVWSAKTFSIRYYRNDGSEYSYVMSDLSSGKPVEMPNVDPWPGYSFAGWAKSKNGGVEYEAGKSYPIDPGYLDTVHLYAVWKPQSYTIAFDANGGVGTMSSTEMSYGAAYEVPGCAYTKSGVSFNGWTTNLAVSVEFHPGDVVSNLTTTADATVTFYAVWSEPRYIAFDGNGADNPDAMTEDVVTFEGTETKALPQCEFEKTGYTFGGWATNAVAATNLVVAYADEAEVISTNLWMAIGETNVFHAVWQTNSYTVVFNANGGTGEMADQHFYYDQGQPLSKYTFSSTLAFRGWATNATGKAVFADEATVTNLTAVADGIVTLYAVLDNGELSKAMHCDNLVWENSGASGTDWEVVEGSGKGYDSSGSAAANTVTWTMSEEQCDSKKLKVSESSGTSSGRLSFWYKTSSVKSNLYSLVLQAGSSTTNLVLSADWKHFGPVEVSDISAVSILLSISDKDNGDNCTVEIDQMKWVPAGSEPTDADRPTINGFEATDGGFRLSVDTSNISDSFGYQILATNELTSGDWPVKTNLTADAIKSGYEIVPEDGEPNMFYKVKVVPK